MCVKLLQLGLTLCDRMACQTPLSMGFPGQEYWYGLPFPSPSGMCSVQFSCSVVSDSLRPHESQHARPPCPSPTPGVHSNYVHRVSDAFQPSHPLWSPFPPAPNPSQHQGLFKWISSLHQHSGLISFRMDWLDLLAVQGTLKNLLQHHNSKASILRRSAFFTVQLSHP